MNTRYPEPQTTRLPNSDQRYPVADEFIAIHYTQPKDGTKPRRYGYTVVILKGDIVRGKV